MSDKEVIERMQKKQKCFKEQAKTADKIVGLFNDVAGELDKNGIEYSKLLATARSATVSVYTEFKERAIAIGNELATHRDAEDDKRLTEWERKYGVSHGPVSQFRRATWMRAIDKTVAAAKRPRPDSDSDSDSDSSSE